MLHCVLTADFHAAQHRIRLLFVALGKGGRSGPAAATHVVRLVFRFGIRCGCRHFFTSVTNAKRTLRMSVCVCVSRVAVWRYSNPALIVKVLLPSQHAEIQAR